MASDTLKYAMYGDCLFIKEAANTASVPPAAEAVSKIRKIRDTAKFVREGIDTINSVKSLISNFLPKPKPSMTDKALDVIKNVSGKAAIPAAILGGYAIKKLIDAVRQHPERRKVYERLVNDPEFKGIDRAKLLEWYATIYHFAPRTTLDYTATKAILRQFATYGTVDLQTLKTLSEVEKNQAGAGKDVANWISWM